STDTSLEDGQSLGGSSSGFVPLVQSNSYTTQTTFTNLSSGVALLELVAYPPGGGETPTLANVVTVAPHATFSSSDIARTLDLAVAINSGAPIADIVRWALRDGSGVVSGKRGFLVVQTPQAVTAQARLIDKVSGDPAVIGQQNGLVSAFSPMVLRIESFSPVG